ncbi:GrpB family protein [uncultured Phycicoccus sp.]|uniref:GrpB family protein n=1 Tax=uncultured Phycicoccus sp. TaxID=661422 RepID=UPI002605331C|nr:GrpB family protein [uncultured Phycicoccus sp.]
MGEIDPLSDEDLQRVRLEPVTPHDGTILLVDSDPEWPTLFAREAARIREVLGPAVIRLEHAGSTSVPGLVAKPIIDIVLVVPDSSDEPSYVPVLTAAGYRLVIREPGWFEHRVFKGPDTDITMHVFTEGAAEIDRMLRFRDRLRADERDRELYARTKRMLAGRRWRHVQHYAQAKSEVVNQILLHASDRVDESARRRVLDEAAAALNDEDMP